MDLPIEERASGDCTSVSCRNHVLLVGKKRRRRRRGKSNSIKITFIFLFFFPLSREKESKENGVWRKEDESFSPSLFFLCLYSISLYSNRNDVVCIWKGATPRKSDLVGSS